MAGVFKPVLLWKLLMVDVVVETSFVFVVVAVFAVFAVVIVVVMFSCKDCTLDLVPDPHYQHLRNLKKCIFL